MGGMTTNNTTRQNFVDNRIMCTARIPCGWCGSPVSEALQFITQCSYSHSVPCSGYDIEACWRKETPRPQDSWHSEYSRADTAGPASGAWSPSSSPSLIRFENSLALSSRAVSQTSIPPLSAVSLASIPSKAALINWLEALSESPNKYCSGAALTSLMPCIVNPGVIPASIALMACIVPMETLSPRVHSALHNANMLTSAQFST
jgi:hypothetical protein